MRSMGDNAQIGRTYVHYFKVVYYLLPSSLGETRSSAHAVVACPTPALALTNRLIIHRDSGFRDGDHVLVRDAFPLTVKYVGHSH